MSESSRCPRCGAEFSAASPGGLCPKCLLQAGLESESVAPSDPAAEAAADRAKTTPLPPKSGFVPPEPAELAPLFPQLEILELLGRGGMGAVYKARQRELGRLVALKILPPEVGSDPEFAERFAREARALAQLAHPGIVTVHDFGRTKGTDAAPLFYFVMEYVDGANLRQLIRQGNVTPAQALAIVPQVCEALQYAHDEGVVHRDIKPENILVDQRGRVKIADFGLSKLMSHSEPGALATGVPDASLTGTEQVMGTLRYMAPEQMLATRFVDHRADIYSLGVVFYELLTGEVPMGRFEPPSHRVAIDVRLDEVVLRALEREPGKRYQRAGDVKTEVDAISSSRADKFQPAETATISGRDELERLVIALWPDKFTAVSEYRRRTGTGLAEALRAVELIATLHGLHDARRERANRLGIVAVVCLGIVAALWGLDRSSLPETARNVLTIVIPLVGLAGLIVFCVAWRKADAMALVAGAPVESPEAATEADEEYARHRLTGPAVALMIAAVANILGNIAWCAVTLSDARTPWDYVLSAAFPAWNVVIGFILLGAAGGLLRCETSPVGDFAITCSLIVPPGLVFAVPAVILYWVRFEDPRIKAAFRRHGRTSDDAASPDRLAAAPPNDAQPSQPSSMDASALRPQLWAAVIGLNLVGTLGGALGLIGAFAMTVAHVMAWRDGPPSFFLPNVGSMLVPPCFIAAGLFVAWGADLLRRFRRYDVCVAASLVAVVLAVLLVGVKQRIEFFLAILPGIYAFWFLQKQAVKDAFAAAPPDERPRVPEVPVAARLVGDRLSANLAELAAVTVGLGIVVPILLFMFTGDLFLAKLALTIGQALAMLLGLLSFKRRLGQYSILLAIVVFGAYSAVQLVVTARQTPITYPWHGVTGFVESQDGPVLSDVMARRLGIPAKQQREANRIFQDYYRQFVKLERRHTTHVREADGRIRIKVEPFADEMHALVKDLHAELSGIVDQRFAPPLPEKGKVHSQLGLFRFAGEATVTAELRKSEPDAAGDTHFFHEEFEWIDGNKGSDGQSGRSPDDFPERYRLYWVEPDDR